ncbi:gluconate kinase [Subtercola boreus]|uniref:Gluconokinase n=2 Tax=Subtercola boreus TaxID=120213 RepID=A0A3E0WAS6_9MICO|nr:gluconate kinase [Subtercola boreus]RFA19921.1 gluconate kinase [Subtercola boreus]RFA26314.1 gluconate kinase [Subtercola boreus]
MGVSGSGKSTIGIALAAALDVTFIDADDLHSKANTQKMAHGIPLTDDDRQPWLASVGQALHSLPAHGPIVACSALRKVYRDALRSSAPDAVFVHLAGGADLIRARMVHRTDHFMPPELLASQLDTLEPLTPDERGVVLDTGDGVASIVDRAVAWLRAGV